MAKVTLQTGPGVFEVLANVCRSHLEALKQFVENSADAIQQAGNTDGHISIHLQYTEKDGEQPSMFLKNVVVSDDGVGMSKEKMKYVLGHIGDSEKVQSALRGEKGIGILAFSLIAEELHIASTDTDGVPSSCLVLKRSWLKTGQAEIIEHCKQHSHSQRGTVVYLEKIPPEASDKLAKDRVKEYLGREFAADLRQGLYAMSISDDHVSEPVPPQRYRGLKALSTSISLGRLGSASVELHVLPWEMADATLSLYGRGGTRICFLTDLDDFKSPPWTDKRLEGHVRCDFLKSTADKSAIVQDQVYQAFVAELLKLEPEIMDMIDKISASSQERRFDVIMHKTGRLIDKFLRYRDRGLLTELTYRSMIKKSEKPAPSVRRKTTAQEPRPAEQKPVSQGRPLDARVPQIGLYAPPSSKSEARSWYDSGLNCICINREHPEFLLAQREDPRCVRYLFAIWVKETLLQEYGADAARLADEMVGMLTEAEPLLW